MILASAAFALRYEEHPLTKGTLEIILVDAVKLFLGHLEEDAGGQLLQFNFEMERELAELAKIPPAGEGSPGQEIEEYLTQKEASLRALAAATPPPAPSTV